MQLFFHLSGEHETLPKGEVLATLESLAIPHSILNSLDQVFIIEAEIERLDELLGRLALTHSISEFYASCEANFDEIIRLIENLNIEIEGSYAVRVKRIKEYSKNVEISKLEREIGGAIWEKGKRSVDLENPRNILFGMLTDGQFIFGRMLGKVDKSKFESRKPHFRPYFHPSSMSPKLARTLVNLSRVRMGERLIDPFCGTGGILIEAGLIGARIFGSDISEEMVNGCEENLRHFEVDDFTLMKENVRDLEDRYSDYFDAIVTDPPYGKSSTTMGLEPGELYKGALDSFRSILKPGKFACIVSPETIDVETVAKDAGFEIVEKHLVRIHRSLTRKIVVMKKSVRDTEEGS